MSSSERGAGTAFAAAYAVGQPMYYIVFIVVAYYIWMDQAVNWLLINADVPHTYLRAGVFSGDELYSERYQSAYSFALTFASTAWFWMPICVCMMIVYRSTRVECASNGRTRSYACCTVMWSIVVVALLALSVVVMAVLGSYATSCNARYNAGGAYNPCDDLRRCAAQSVWSNADNACPNVGAWPAPYATFTLEDDARWNIDFTMLLVASVVFAGTHLFFMMMPLALWLKETGPRRYGDPGTYNADALDPALREFVVPPPPPPPTALPTGAPIRRVYRVK